VISNNTAELHTALFDYDLPSHLIAQTPSAKRDESRLMVVDRATGKVEHRTFSELRGLVREGDVFFRNDAAVLPARLLAVRPTGGQVECFLLSPSSDQHIWRCLIKPGKKLPVGAKFAHLSGAFRGEVVSKSADGTALIRFSTPNEETITSVANRIGEVPLPPYISRQAQVGLDSTERTQDIERYQTVYANRTRQVAVAAPTAGLHFTPELLRGITDAGITTYDLTLHVGLGTFQPISTERVADHAIHREIYEIPAATQRALFSSSSRRRIAIGTTTVRTVEDFLATHDEPVAGNQSFVAEAGIFIYPPRAFRGVDALITNFHQPRSTLLCLVAAFLSPNSTAGITWLKELYSEAIQREYRFFSYGDAMLIV
jgi:S-adenosylmethionine:tRNA ribosyltransferase-isomerase